MTDYRDHPVSLAEARADKDHDASKWSPRDALISLLREIDAGGVEPDALVIAYYWESEDGGVSTSFRAASPNAVVTVGLLERAKAKIIAGG